MMKNMNQIVYLIIPIFNTSPYLSKCLKSVFSQTYSNIKAICINDGSTDDSLEILNAFRKDNSNMIVINKKNGGLSSARNEGLEYIKDFNNAFILYLDSDDWIKEDYVERLVNYCNKTNSDVVCCNYYDCGPFDEKMNCQEIEYIYTSEEAVKALFNGELQSHAPCKLFRASLWKNFRYDDSIIFMEDQCTTFQIFLKAKKIARIPYAGYYYFHHEGSLCQSKMTNKKILSALQSYIYNYNYKFPNELVDEFRNLLLSQFANIYLMMFPRFDSENCSADELEKWNFILNFAKKTKAIHKFKPRGFKNRLKKTFYKISPKIYKRIFKLFLKKYD